MNTKIGIIGGGPAGLMAAAVLVEEDVDAQIFVYEATSHIGGKIPVSGGGRCNLTTALSDKREILDNYTRGAKFLRFAIEDFPPDKVREWFMEHGLKTKVDGGDRVFPTSDRSNDVVAVFDRILSNRSNVRIALKSRVTHVYQNEAGKFVVGIVGREDEFDRLVIATGGDGYSLAESLGHDVTPLAPSLVSFVARELWPGKLAGLSLPDCALRCTLADKTRISVHGDCLFTHFGVTGPAVFSLSSKVAYEKIDQTKPLKVFISPVAERGVREWDELLTAKMNLEGAKKMRTILSAFFPDRLADRVLNSARLDGDKQAAKISRDERLVLAKVLGDGIELTLTSRKKGGEIVTAGGVSLDEINPKSCESRLRPGLYFIGEILDVDGVTGGFNLQNCWMTAHVAATSISRKLSK